jgi:putative ABC transport system permease protein
MWGYYLRLGFASLRRNPVLTALMVLTLAVGVSASMTTLTILLGMSGDPIPHKSDRLLVPLIDNRPLEGAGNDPDPPQQLTWRDAEALWTAARADRQVPLFGMSPTVDPGRADLAPFFSDGIATGRDFFAMFEAPFLVGGSWTAEHDRDAAPVVVLGRDLAERLFETPEAATNKAITLSGHEFTVIGVIDRWQPLPRYYRLVGGNRFTASEQVFMPIRTAMQREMAFDGNISCNSRPDEPGFQGLLKSECTMIQFWVEVADGAARRVYADFLAAYVQEQKALGRLPRDLNNRLHDVREWMDVQGVVENDTRTAAWLSFGFLLVCLVNTVGLLLAKFSSRPGEIGVRRALGAARREIIRQYLTEAAVIGLVGAVVGVLMTWGALAYIRGSNRRMELIAQLDLPMLLTAVAVAVGAAILAGLLPTWRACQVLPAMQLKSQ